MARMHLQVIAEVLGVQSYPMGTSQQARDKVLALLTVGYRELTAELVDNNGDVIAYYDGRTWHEGTP